MLNSFHVINNFWQNKNEAIRENFITIVWQIIESLGIENFDHFKQGFLQIINNDKSNNVRIKAI